MASGEYVTDDDIDEACQKLQTRISVDIASALRNAMVQGVRMAEAKQHSKSDSPQPCGLGWKNPAPDASVSMVCSRSSTMTIGGSECHDSGGEIPREPTPEMIEAGEALIPWSRGTESRRMVPDPEAIYAAMVEAFFRARPGSEVHKPNCSEETP